jgi:hypothetical protein
VHSEFRFTTGVSCYSLMFDGCLSATLLKITTRSNRRTGALGEMEWRQLWRPSYAPRSGFHKGPSTVTAR